jgi:TRAP-type C4-dicarboxylate transport system substrate-binding protein
VARWSDDERDAVTAAVAEATAQQRRFAQEDDVTCTQAMTQDGVTFTTLTPSERDAFAAATRAEVDATRASFDPELIALFEADIAKVKEVT